MTKEAQVEERQETNFLRLLQQDKYSEEWLSNIPDELEQIVHNIKKRLATEKDLVIGITSFDEGEGKSSLGATIGFLLNPEVFDLRENIAYIADFEKTKQQFWRIPQRSSLQLDEAIKALHKLDFQSKLQRMLTDMFLTERSQEKVVILCMPRFTDFTESVRNHKIKIWFKIMKRGYVVVHVKDKVSEVDDPWWLDQNNNIMKKKWKHKKVAELSFSEIMDMERSKRTYLIDFKIPPLPKSVEDVYKEIKRTEHLRAAQLEKEDEVETKLEREMDELIFNATKFIKYLKPITSQKAIFESLKVSKNRFKRVMKLFDPRGYVFGGQPIEELVAQGIIPGFVLDVETPDEVETDNVPDTSILLPKAL